MRRAADEAVMLRVRSLQNAFRQGVEQRTAFLERKRVTVFFLHFANPRLDDFVPVERPVRAKAVDHHGKIMMHAIVVDRHLAGGAVWRRRIVVGKRQKSEAAFEIAVHLPLIDAVAMGSRMNLEGMLPIHVAVWSAVAFRNCHLVLLFFLGLFSEYASICGDRRRGGHQFDKITPVHCRSCYDHLKEMQNLGSKAGTASLPPPPCYYNADNPLFFHETEKKAISCKVAKTW